MKAELCPWLPASRPLGYFYPSPGSLYHTTAHWSCLAEYLCVCVFVCVCVCVRVFCEVKGRVWLDYVSEGLPVGAVGMRTTSDSEREDLF